VILALGTKSGLEEFRVLSAAVVVVVSWMWHCEVLDLVKVILLVFPRRVYDH
jgi:hypothetical protein